MNLSRKLLLGFMIPVVMLLGSGIWSFARFHSLSDRVQNMLHENDRSIRAANTMTIALERMDSASLLRLTGDDERARAIQSDADSLFLGALRVASGNATIEGEVMLLDSLQGSFKAYRSALSLFAESPTFSAYSNTIAPRFFHVRRLLDRLHTINSEEMYDQALRVGQQAYRATLPGTILVGAAVLFTLIFAWLLHVHIVRPLRAMIASVEQWPTSGTYRPGEISTGDEVEQLHEALLEANRYLTLAGHGREDRP